MKFDKRSEQSGYLTIGDWTIYVEVSPTTKNVPDISAWQSDWPKDCTMSFSKSWEFSDHERTV